MKNTIMLGLYIVLITIFLPLYHGDSPANTTEAVIIQNNFIKNKCFNDADCNEHGRCVDQKRCECTPGWITYDNTNRKNENCMYEQRAKTIAFIASLLVGTLGVDWFYLSRGKTVYIIIGVIKLLLGCGCCSGWPLLKLGKDSDSKAAMTVGRVVGAIFSLASPAWWIVDWARILANKFPDGNGAPLKPF